MVSGADHETNCEQYEEDAFKMEKRGNHADALGLYDKAIDEAEQSNNRLQLPAVLCRAAESRMQHEQFAAAEPLLRQALSKDKELSQQADLDAPTRDTLTKEYIKTEFDLANLLTDQKKYSEAEVLYKELQAVPKVDADTRSAINEAYINMLKSAGKLKDANEIFMQNAADEYDVRNWRRGFDTAKEAWLLTGSEDSIARLNLCDRVAMQFGDRDPRKAASLCFRAVREFRQGNIDAARTDAQESDEIYKRMTGKLPFEASDAPQMLSRIESQAEHYDPALRYSERAIEEKRKLAQPYNAEQAVNLAQALTEQATLLKRKNPHSDTKKLDEEATHLRWTVQDWRGMLDDSTAKYLEGDVPEAKELADLAVSKAKAVQKQPGVEACQAWQVIMLGSHQPQAETTLLNHVANIEKEKGKDSHLLVIPLLALAIIRVENHQDGDDLYRRAISIAKTNRTEKLRLAVSFKKRYKATLSNPGSI